MSLGHRARHAVAAGIAAALLFVGAPQARAAEPYEINVILSLTGFVSFVGQGQLKSLKALESYVNKNGGINGRPISFVVADDQSNPQTTVQLAQGLIAKHVPVILGPTGPDTCAAVTPLVAQSGPVLYCVAPTGQAPPGGYVFLTLFSGDTGMAVAVRYLRERGFRKVAFLTSTDAAGQDAERALNAALQKPENASLQIVTRQHFGTNDLSLAAQVAAIKAAAPDALIAWAAGTAAGNMMRGLHDGGLDLPTMTSSANLNVPFMKNFATVLPTNLYAYAAPYYGQSIVTNNQEKAAMNAMTSALGALNAHPDQIAISSWDPAMLIVDALRKLGTDTTAAKLRAYLAGLKNWVGVNGPYDFTAVPQRGLGENGVLVVKFDPSSPAGAVPASRFGGAPLPGK